MGSKKGVLQSLRKRGFDQSYYNRSRGSHRVQCSQCKALVINGMACHETGCTNERRTSK
jgi:hypothetical protein